MSTIVRKGRRGFVTIPNDVVWNRTLSYRALGLLAALLALPDGASVTAEGLALGEGREGRDAVRAARDELIAAGHFHRRKRQTPATKSWITETTITAEPTTTEAAWADVDAENPQDPAAENPSPVRPAETPQTPRSDPAAENPTSANQRLSTSYFQDRNTNARARVGLENRPTPTPPKPCRSCRSVHIPGQLACHRPATPEQRSAGLAAAKAALRNRQEATPPPQPALTQPAGGQP